MVEQYIFKYRYEKKLYLLIFILIFTVILLKSTIRRNVRTDETKRFIRMIMESNEKIIGLKFELSRPSMCARIDYKGDLEKEELQYI